MLRGAGIFAIWVVAGCCAVLGVVFFLMPVGSLLRSAAVSHAPSQTRTFIITADNGGYTAPRQEDVRPIPKVVEQKPVPPVAPTQERPPAAAQQEKPPEKVATLPAPTAQEAQPPQAQSQPAPPMGAPTPPQISAPAVTAPVAAPAAPAEVTAAPPPAAEPPSDADKLALLAKKPARLAGFNILQIGDSHTAGDFFSGEVRRRLQALYGNGGPGYVVAGLPRDVITKQLTITTSKGWTYDAIQHSSEIGKFWLSGFNAVAKAKDETLTFAAPRALRYDVIDFEVVRQPGGGTIDVELDGRHEGTYDLSSAKVEPVVIRLVPKKGPTERVRRITVITKNDGIVTIASVGIYNTHAGITYSNVGYPGATVDIVNKFDKTLFANDLQRINPQIVVLAYGTNEASKEHLDRAAYARNYEHVIAKVRAALPSARIVMVGPPEGSELPPDCKQHEKATCGPAKEAKDKACLWRPLPNLEAVREIQKAIAKRHDFVYWDWGAIMPKQCGPHQWVTASPPLMTKDHVHFTVRGYDRSADAFLKTLIPVIEPMRARASVADN